MTSKAVPSIYGASVTPDFFRVFGLQPMVGRGFSAGDDVEGRSHVIVLSHQLWARDFVRDPGVIGKTILLSGTPMTVIGVMPAGFDFPRLADVSQIMNWAPEQAEFWTPFVITSKTIEDGNLNYYVEGVAEKNPMMRRGYSRDHRPDCEQMVMRSLSTARVSRSATRRWMVTAPMCRQWKRSCVWWNANTARRDGSGYWIAAL